MHDATLELSLSRHDSRPLLRRIMRHCRSVSLWTSHTSFLRTEIRWVPVPLLAKLWGSGPKSAPFMTGGAIGSQRWKAYLDESKTPTIVKKRSIFLSRAVQPTWHLQDSLRFIYVNWRAVLSGLMTARSWNNSLPGGTVQCIAAQIAIVNARG